MKYVIAILTVVTLVLSRLSAQELVIRAKVTYIANNMVYVVPGRDSGIRDSSDAFLISNKDTIAVLSVFATSSKSAVLSILKNKRPIVVGDLILIPSKTQITIQRPTVQASSSDSNQQQSVGTAVIPMKDNSKSLITLQGRINFRYLTWMPSGSATNIMTQPGVSVNLRGRFNEQPLQFSLLGNFRSLAYGSTSPFQSNSTNRTRIYRLSLDYDDGTTALSAGRIAPSFAPSAGYIDGAVLSHRFGDIVIGGSAGFEPSFSQQNISTDFKKIVLFTGYQPKQNTLYSTNIAYSRTFYQSAIDRELISAWMNIFPVPDLNVFAQSDVDLRTKKNNELVSKAKLTNLFANINYRLTNFFSLGAGIAAWRPSYSFAAVRDLSDSLIDNTLRTNPTLSVNFYFSSGISLYSTYSPRTSDEGFGKEYSNYNSIGITDLFRQGFTVRTSMNTNKTFQTKINGYSVNVQKNLINIVDLTFRYQFNQYTYMTSDITRSSKTIAIDALWTVIKPISFWGTVERFIGLDADATTVSLEMSWSF